MLVLYVFMVARTAICLRQLVVQPMAICTLKLLEVVVTLIRCGILEMVTVPKQICFIEQLDRVSMLAHLLADGLVRLAFSLKVAHAAKSNSV